MTKTTERAVPVQPIYWKLDDVAAALSVSRRTLDALRRRDDFPREVRLEPNGFPRYLVEDVKAWAVAQRQPAAA